MSDEERSVLQAEVMKAVVELQHFTFDVLIREGVTTASDLAARLAEQATKAREAKRSDAANVFDYAANYCRNRSPDNIADRKPEGSA